MIDAPFSIPRPWTIMAPIGVQLYSSEIYREVAQWDPFRFPFEFNEYQKALADLLKFNSYLQHEAVVASGHTPDDVYEDATWLSENATVHLKIGQRVGASSFIAAACNPWDVVITEHPESFLHTFHAIVGHRKEWPSFPAHVITYRNLMDTRYMLSYRTSNSLEPPIGRRTIWCDNFQQSAALLRKDSQLFALTERGVFDVWSSVGVRTTFVFLQ